MEELVRTHDLVLLSCPTAQFAEENIDAVVFDAHTSVIEGSISAIQRRVMVVSEDLARARLILAEAEIIQIGGRPDA